MNTSKKIMESLGSIEESSPNLICSIKSGRGSYTNLLVSVSGKSVKFSEGSELVLELMNSDLEGTYASLSIRQGAGTYSECNLDMTRKSFVGKEYVISDSEGSRLVELTIK